MLFHNEDWEHFIITRTRAGIELTEDVIKEYVYKLKDTQITDFVMNVNGTVSTAASDVFMTYSDKYHTKQENGEPVDYTNDPVVKGAYYLLEEKKIDMYQLWTQVSKEIGINPWISIRVNDCHGCMMDQDRRKSKFIDDHPECYISAHRDQVGYFDRCLDFKHELVRDTLLRYIDEMLSRYDVYGIELDFTREIFLLQFGCEYGKTELITAFLKEVFAVIKKNEEKWGHKIKRAFLVPAEPNALLEQGLDVASVVDELDFLSIISRWETTDTDMPIELWKQILRDKDVKLGCGQQLLYKQNKQTPFIITWESAAYGQAVANLSRGADYVYLYNYMDMGNREEIIEDYIYDECIKTPEVLKRVQKNIGNMETLMKQTRSHVVTYRDYLRYDFCDNSVLPVVFNGTNPAYHLIKIPVGKVPEGADVKLILGIKEKDCVAPDDLKIYVNAAKCQFEVETKINPNIYDGKCLAYKVSGEMYGIMYVEIKTDKHCSIEYAEIKVIPR